MNFFAYSTDRENSTTSYMCALLLNADNSAVALDERSHCIYTTSVDGRDPGCSSYIWVAV